MCLRDHKPDDMGNDACWGMMSFGCTDPLPRNSVKGLPHSEHITENRRGPERHQYPS